ncbi:MAG: hypothetical protein H7Y33_19760 [Cytophagales bacterium]|nr:hypothetical protein [Rhizobacter sp.]
MPSSNPYNFGPHEMAVAPSNGQVIYIGTTNQGIYKSIDGGTSWLGRVDRNSYDCSGRLVDTNAFGVASGRNWALAVDPGNPDIVYTTAGFGHIQGVWKSTDGGVSWRQKLCPGSVRQSGGIQGDIGAIHIDPNNPLHLLVATHSAWQGGGYTGGDSGLYESTDGGESFSPHAPTAFPGVGTHLWVSFLGRRDDGNVDTEGRYWILNSQTGGAWRTTDAGASWQAVNWVPAGRRTKSHAGSGLYRSRANVLYLGFDYLVGRSEDNGRTWRDANLPQGPDGYAGIVGDGTYIYAMPSNTGLSTTFSNTGIGAPFMYSLESDGTQWAPYNDQRFSNGPLRMAFDPVRRQVFAVMWCAGVWRLSVGVPGP